MVHPVVANGREKTRVLRTVGKPIGEEDMPLLALGERTRLGNELQPDVRGSHVSMEDGILSLGD